MPKLPAFTNEPVLELRRASVRAELSQALARVDRELPLTVPVSVGGESRTGEEVQSTDPGDPGRIVAHAAGATGAEVAEAVSVATEGFRTWSAMDAEQRAAALMRAAAWLRERRLELAALEVRECAKPWPEADGDVCEAIDFLEYYARGRSSSSAARAAPGTGRAQRAPLLPRGVVAVISPWNFPLAIPCGMTAAALATGNAVVLKPAEQSPGCAHNWCRRCGPVAFLRPRSRCCPGKGRRGGARGHPGVHTIAFTGSLPVGLEIVRTAADTVPGQRHIKRVVAELGGKNCVIVDADADLDEAARDRRLGVRVRRPEVLGGGTRARP